MDTFWKYCVKYKSNNQKRLSNSQYQENIGSFNIERASQARNGYVLALEKDFRSNYSVPDLIT